MQVEWLGTGTPVPFPDPGPKTVDVAIVEENRWVSLAEEVVGRLDGVSVLRIARIDSTYSLSEVLRPARILVWPSRVEGMSRIAREARGVGTVPVVLDTNPFVTSADHGGGLVLVDDLSGMAHEISTLLGDRGGLERLSDEGIESARLQVSWKHYLDRVSRSLQAVATCAGPAAAALDIVGRETWLDVKGLTDNRTALERRIEELRVDANELQTETERLRARVEELESESGRLQAHTELLQAQLSQSHFELEAKDGLISEYQARRLVRLMDRPLTGAVYRGGLKLARWRGFHWQG